MIDKDWLEEHIEESILLADGLEDCFVGIARIFDKQVAVYDLEKVLAHLQSQGMTEDEAQEYFDYNIVGSYVGEQTPAFLRFQPAPVSRTKH